jgi:putative transposase
MTCRRPYGTDLTDPEWEQLKQLVPLAKPGGRPPIHSRREILNGIFYTVRSDGAWKLLPHDLLPRRTVYHYFWLWRRDGTWQRIHDSIRAFVRKADRFCMRSAPSPRASNEPTTSRTSERPLAASQTRTTCASRSRSLSVTDVATYCDLILAGT